MSYPESSKVPYQSSTIEADLQAFNCTITLLTSLRNYRNDIYPTNKQKLRSIDERVLKLCTALAQIAVIDHEVVAVGVEHLDGAPNPSAPLQVVVSTSSLNKPSEPDYSNPLVLKAKDELESENRKTVGDLSHSLPTIIPTKVPKAISSLREDFNVMFSELQSTGRTPKPEEYLDFKAMLNKYLFVDRSVGHTPSLEEHLWALEMIFNVWKEKHEFSPRLLTYIATTCYPKMNNRFNNPKSRSYLQALRNISVESISFVKSPINPSKFETREDVKFLKMFSRVSLGLPEGLDNQFLEGYDSIYALGDGSGIHSTLYNSNTCREFHRLLLSFLETFQKDLATLVQLRGDISQSTSELNIQLTYQFNMLAERVVWIGHGLCLLSRSAALRIHLQNIEPLLLLPEPYNYDEEDEDEDDELDGEFEDQPAEHISEAVQHPDRRERFCKWLKIVISHFDAALILVGAISGPNFPPITIQILRTTHVEKTSMSWKEVLKNPRYFPTYSVPARGYPEKSNGEILQFLIDAVSSSEARRLVKEVDADWKDLIALSGNTGTREATQVRERVDNIAKNLKAIHGAPAYSRTAKAILNSISDGFTDDNTFSLEHIQVDSITADIKFMIKICDIGSSLTKDYLKITGRTHCEVSLASLLSTEAPVTLEGFEDILGKMQPFGPIIGVSKRCCPVCHDVLYRLKCKVSQTPFHTRGHHNTISSCALPNWLPSRIVDEMNELYGRKLKEALTIFIGCSELQRHRTSSGSSALSINSETQDEVEINENLTKNIRMYRLQVLGKHV